MIQRKYAVVTLITFMIAALLAACSGGGGGSGSTAPSTTLMGGAKQGVALNLTTAVTTLAGTAGVTGSADGTGTAATFNNHQGITTDGASLYVADSSNNTVRKIH